MKKIILIAAVLLTFFRQAEAQTYAQQKEQQKQILAHSADYIGKPFSVLYSALTLKPKSVMGGIGHSNRFVEFNHSFYYVDTTNYVDTANYIYIEWQEPILLTEAKKYQNLGFRAFNSQEYPTYANKIIKKIEVYPDPYAVPPPPPKWIVVSCVYKKVLVDGLYQWRYEITKKYCDKGVLGSQTKVSYSTTSVPVQNCVGGDDLVPLSLAAPAK